MPTPASSVPLPIDLRSDTVTRPSAAMRAAIAAAPVGDDQYGEDPTTNQLQERVATLLGKEAALFFPSGTMTNQVAVRVLTRPGDEAIVSRESHLGWHETGGVAANSGVQLTEIGGRGVFTAAEFLAACKPHGHLLHPPTTLVAIENTHNRMGGVVFPQEEVGRICAAARERGIVTLVDGAHAPGQLPLDIAAVGADYYTGNCHKWMCAPKGAAFLHVRPERQAGIAAPVVSWGTVAEAMSGKHRDTGAFDAYTGRDLLSRRLQWQGTRDIAAFLTAPAAIEFQQQHEWPAWQRRCHDLACATRARVAQHNGLPAAAPDEAFGQMVVIPVATDDPAALQRRLFEQHRIEVPVTQHAGQTFVRVSVQA